MIKYFVWFYLIFGIFSGLISISNGIILLKAKKNPERKNNSTVKSYTTLIRGLLSLIFSCIFIILYYAKTVDEWFVVVAGIFVITIPGLAIMYIDDKNKVEAEN